MNAHTLDRFDTVCKAVGMTGDEPIDFRRDFVEAIRTFAARKKDSDMEEAAVKVLDALWSESMAAEEEDDLANALPDNVEAKRLECEAMESAWFEQHHCIQS